MHSAYRYSWDYPDVGTFVGPNSPNAYCGGLRPVPPIRGAVDDDDDSVDDGHDGHDEVDGDVEYATVDDDAGDGEGGV